MIRLFRKPKPPTAPIARQRLRTITRMDRIACSDPRDIHVAAMAWGYHSGPTIRDLIDDGHLQPYRPE